MRKILAFLSCFPVVFEDEVCSACVGLCFCLLLPGGLINFMIRKLEVQLQKDDQLN